LALNERALSHIEATSLENILVHDASDNLFSAAVSIADALRGLNSGFFSWATIKLYYAMFYSVRSVIALGKKCIFYIGTKPKWIEASPGRRTAKAAGLSHEFTLTFFEQHFGNHYLLSQPIDGSVSLWWLLEHREEANYRSRGFCEPEVPPHFEFVDSAGIRKTINAYMSDSADVYTFDPQHAMLALPLRALLIARESLLGRGASWPGDEERASFLRTAYRDSAGPLSSMRKIVE
jgi:hypothetical protein